jgi:hypothetical protein
VRSGAARAGSSMWKSNLPVGENILISVFEVNDFFLTSFKNSRKGNNRKRLGLEEDSEVIELKP